MGSFHVLELHFVGHVILVHGSAIYFSIISIIDVLVLVIRSVIEG